MRTIKGYDNHIDPTAIYYFLSHLKADDSCS